MLNKKCNMIILLSLILSFSAARSEDNDLPAPIKQLVTVYNSTNIIKSSVIDSDAAGLWQAKLSGTVDAKEVFDFYEGQMRQQTNWSRVERSGNGDGDHVIFSDGEYRLKIVVWESLDQIIITLEK